MDNNKVRIPYVFMEEEQSDKITSVLFSSGEIIEERENTYIISISDTNSNTNNMELPKELVSSWQFRPYVSTNDSD